MIWKIQDRSYDFQRTGGWIMGVLNVTPDSFSDGGQFVQLDPALTHARQMIAEGATVIDIGGESSRPGASSISIEEEKQRVLPVIEALRAESDVLISIDSCKPAVARAAMEAGANIINDISGLRAPEMLEVVAATGAGAVCMHMLGTPVTMQQTPSYDDVVGEVRAFFEEGLAACAEQKIDPSQIVFDPGIGFGKTVAHNLELLRNLALLRLGDRPMLVGVSRKSFLSKIIGTDSPNDRFWPTVALTAHCREAGVEIIRVHDVRPNFHSLRMMEAILGQAASVHE
ncbi:MAG: dihydropteroate synthase [Chthoniobacterales bacterium]